MTGHPDQRRLEVALPEGERREILVHVQGCPACRSTMAEADPASLFALLALESPAPERLEAVSRNVEGSLAASTPSLLDAWRERGLPRLLPLAAAAAAVLFFVVVGLRGGPEPAMSELPGPAIPEQRADVRVTETPGPAHVVDLTVGDTQIVMIFASEIEL